PHAEVQQDLVAHRVLIFDEQRRLERRAAIVEIHRTARLVESSLRESEIVAVLSTARDPVTLRDDLFEADLRTPPARTRVVAEHTDRRLRGFRHIRWFSPVVIRCSE